MMDYLLFIWFLWTWTWTIIYLTQKGMAHDVTPKELINKPVIIVISTFRSGSSFTGEMLRFPGSMYYFEPYHFFGIVTRTPKEGLAMDMFEGLINCDFNYLFNDVKWFDVRFVVKPIILWKYILGQRIDYKKRVSRKLWREKADNLSNHCLNSTGIVMKTVRLRMDTMVKLFEEMSDKRRKNVHVLLNVRDPRAVINSRRKFKWCNERNKCIRSDELCKDVMADYEIYLRMKEKYPNNFHVQRFEDLIENPNEHSTKLLYSMGLNHDKRLADFIQSHTSKDAHPIHAYDTHRYSKAIKDRWTWEMDQEWIEEVEDDCKDVFETFNYEKV